MKTNQDSEEKFDKTFSVIFRKFRENKKFSRPEAASGVMSTTSLLQFETGQSMPAFDKVFRMLKNIGVTMLEFEDEYNRSSQNQDVILYDTSISDAYLAQDVEKLKSILEEIEKEIHLFEDTKKYKIDKWHVEALIKKLDPSHYMEVADIFALKDYLLDLKEWGLYDIHLFGHTVNAFCTEDFDDLVTKMLNLTLNTASLHNVEHAVIQTMINVIDSCLTRKEFDLAGQFIKHLKRLKVHEYYMYEKFILKYNEASLEYQNGKESALEKMKKCREIALFCECTGTASVIASEIADFETKAEAARDKAFAEFEAKMMDE